MVINRKFMIVLSVFLLTECGGPDINTGQVFSINNLTVVKSYYYDYSGVSTHGELFDFQEYIFDKKSVGAIIASPSFLESPNYEKNYSFYKKKLVGVDFTKWTKTPINRRDSAIVNYLLNYSNLNDYEESKKLLKSNILNNKGNFYAYFSGYPAGTTLYIFCPKKGQLFIIRKRG